MDDDVRHCGLLVRRLGEALDFYAHQCRGFAAEMEAIRTQWRGSVGSQIDQQYLAPLCQLRDRAGEGHRQHRELLARVTAVIADAAELHRAARTRSEQIRSLAAQSRWELGEAEAELDQVRGSVTAARSRVDEAVNLLGGIGG